MLWQVVKFLLWGGVPAVSLLGVTLVARAPNVNYGQVLQVIGLALVLMSIWGLALLFVMEDQIPDRLALSIFWGIVGTAVVAVLMIRIGGKHNAR